MAAKEQKDQFRFRKHDCIGVAAAEEDEYFLRECFVDTGDLTTLRSCQCPQRLIVGRTGAGKSALLERLAQVEQRVIKIEPESLALNHIANSTILPYLAQLGVKFDTFFRLLWRHAFAVELIRAHFDIRSETDRASFLLKATSLLKGQRALRALKYVEEYGQRFWQETETHVKEFTTKLEEDIRAKMGTKVFSLDGGAKLSEEQKLEVVQRAQNVVDSVQMKALSDLLDMLAELLDDPQKRYFITIDRLDENWIEDRFRYLLIRALIETVKDFKKVQHVKVVVALRLDLIERVYRITRDAGFQEEKYESLYLPVSWSRDRLIQVLDSRITFLVKNRYTGQAVTHKQILPTKIGKQPTIDYMLERTLMRPRDLIQFFNYAINLATDSPTISTAMLTQAEGEYSRARLRSLADEWFADYPNLLQFSELLKNRNPYFDLSELPSDECEEFCLNAAANGFERQDDLSQSATQLAEGHSTVDAFRKTLAHVFYRVGLIGLKTGSQDKTSWSSDGRRSISMAEIHSDVRVHVHPFAWRAFGVLGKSATTG